MASLDPKGPIAGSCNHCRQHKTKCIRLEDGSCRRCLRAGRACVTTNTKIGRPYYQSSKEQYDLMASVVRHFLPHASLSRESLREVVARLPAGHTTEATSPTANDDRALPSSGLGLEAPGVKQINFNAVELPLSPMHTAAEVQATSPHPAAGSRPAQETIFSPPSQTQPQSTNALTSLLVSRLDEYGHYPTPPRCSDAARPSPRGSTSRRSNASHIDETFPIESIARREDREITRYDSGTSWIAFFSKIHATVGPQYDGLLRNPLLTFDEDGASKQVEMVSAHNLPPRSEFEQASSKFFAEVNCVTYILSYERFHTHMIRAFDQRNRLSHSVFMLLCLILSFDERYEQYFSKACEHVEYVLEEGTVASVEALMLIGSKLALCRMNRDQKNLAWISIGCASRIAQTLGLHLDESCWDEKSQVVIEDRKRLWWSLYDLEICLAYRLGRCPGIDLACCRVRLPSETVFNLVPNSPPDYHRAVSQLSTINGLIVQDLYGPRSAQICLDSRADELIDDVQRFWEDLPQHLKPNAQLAPSHRRAVLYLGLRYDYTILLATRPSIASCWKDPDSCSANLMQRVEISEAANKRSLVLLKTMAQADVLNHKSYLDASYILANILMFILRMVKDPSRKLLNEASEYRTILQGTQHLKIGRDCIRAFEATINDVRSMLTPNGQLHQADYTSIDDFLQEFMVADEIMWPTWPTDGLINAP